MFIKMQKQKSKSKLLNLFFGSIVSGVLVLLFFKLFLAFGVENTFSIALAGSFEYLGRSFFSYFKSLFFWQLREY